MVTSTQEIKRNTDPLPTLQTEELSSRAHAPIGVFDSGAGGLTILADLRQELPQEDYIYFGDTGHCPYGVRSEADITELSLQANHFLIEQGVKLIVVACNTASQAALHTLRANYSTPFVGVVPAVKPAVHLTKCKRIGIAATNRAAQAAYLRQLIDTFADGIEVSAIGCPELVTLVERGELEGPLVEETLRTSLQPLLSNHVDVIVLACTHFPALRLVIERIAGEDVQVIDSGAAIARRVHAILEEENAMHPTHADDKAMGTLQVWCSGDPPAFSQVASKLLGYPVTAQRPSFPFRQS